MTPKRYGTVVLQPDIGGIDQGSWVITCEPHIMMKLKRLFTKIHKGEMGNVRLSNTPENCCDILWFLQRYPMTVTPESKLVAGSNAHLETTHKLDKILDPNYKPAEFKLAIPLRDYQRRADEIYLNKGALLVADDVGTGKSAIAIGSFADKRTLPAIVVTLANVLPRQWKDEIARFAPDLHTHIIKKGTPYELPLKNGKSPDVIIINYHKLAGWAETLAKYAKSICFDEIQELRHPGSNKYAAARHLSENIQLRLGLSATPIFNYGGEFHHVSSILHPTALGTYDEFTREWCVNWGRDNARITDPVAFGTYLRDNHLMIRRTRHDVGRELPPLSTIPCSIESDTRELHRLAGNAVELARIILDRSLKKTNQERWEASGQFDMLMRQSTGIAKAAYVADFVRILVQNGERVLLGGWHREVYSIWAHKLKDLNPVWFTGSESPNQKQAAKESFMKKEAGVMMMSLRAGQGVDGLQKCCRTVVVGELDWSPAIHEQFIGRVFRDGQNDPVSAYFLISEEGSDPVVADICGIKRSQSDGIRDPNAPAAEIMAGNGKDIARLAADYLHARGVKVEEPALANQSQTPF